jgi:hypothetical protein
MPHVPRDPFRTNRVVDIVPSHHFPIRLSYSIAQRCISEEGERETITNERTNIGIMDCHAQHTTNNANDLDGYAYVFRAPGLSRSGRKLKPKVFNDGTVSLVGHAEEVLAKTGSPKTEINSSAEDCVSPIAEDIKDRLSIVQVDTNLKDEKILDGRNGNGKNSGGRLQSRKRKYPNRVTGGGIFKAAAVQVLKDEGQLMTTGDIARVALQRGYISCSGKTPEATMASALYTDIKRRSGDTVFIRPKEGLFGLKEWDKACIGADYNGQGSQDEGKRTDNKRRAGNDKVQVPADTTGSRCFAQPEAPTHYRDGLIDLLSAAEKVNGNTNRNLKANGVELREQNRLVAPVGHRRRVLITSNFHHNNGLAPQNGQRNNIHDVQTVSIGEKGSFANLDREDSEDKVDEDNDNCVQSPQTRLLSAVIEHPRPVTDLSGHLRDVRACVEACPDVAARERGRCAVIELERMLVLERLYNNAGGMLRGGREELPKEILINNLMG